MLLCAAASVAATAAITASDYSAYISIPNIGGTLYWKRSGNIMKIAISAPTTNWIGFGLAEAGGMVGADIVTYESISGTWSVRDRFATQRGWPTEDVGCQDWTLVSEDRASGATQIELSREVDTEEPQDHPFTFEPTWKQRIIIAYGNHETIQYHGQSNRVAMQVDFSATNGQQSSETVFDRLKASDPNIKTTDWTVEGFSVPVKGNDGKGTSYSEFCLDSTKIGNIHVVGMEPIISNGSTPYIHHSTFYAHMDTATCSKRAPDGVYRPYTLFYAWAPGSPGLILPEVAGHAVGGGRAAAAAAGYIQENGELDIHEDVDTIANLNEYQAYNDAVWNLAGETGAMTTDPTIAVSATCSQYHHDNCRGVGKCFGTCYTRYFARGCTDCWQHLHCAACYGATDMLGAAKNVVSQCYTGTIRAKSASGSYLPAELGHEYDSFNMLPEVWNVSSIYPVTISCTRHISQVGTVKNFASAADLTAAYNQGELDALLWCVHGASGEQTCNRTSTLPAGAHTISEHVGWSAWDATQAASLTYPMAVVAVPKVYTAYRMMRNMDRFQSMTMQIHYNNPNGDKNHLDYSGVRLYYTETERQYTAGVIQTGDPNINGIGDALQAGVSRDVYTCPALGSCTEKPWVNASVTVFSSFLHMHQVGHMMSGQVLRNGEAVVTHKYDWYDFDIQSGYPMPQTFQVQKDDTLHIECVFNVPAGKTVRYGLGSLDEMCVWYIGYYPKQPLEATSCGSGAPCVQGSRSRKPVASVAALQNAATAQGVPRFFGAQCQQTPQPAPTPAPSTPSPVSAGHAAAAALVPAVAAVLMAVM